LKRIWAILLALLTLCGAAAAGDFRTVTGLDETAKKLEEGVTIDEVYYTDGYGFSTSEFTTADPEEIEALWTALNRITIGEKSDMSITDWYPQIVFRLSDGTYAHVSFEAHWLSLGMENYEVENAEPFWNLTAALVQKYDEAAGY
jgi:hypothetical protein